MAIFGAYFFEDIFGSTVIPPKTCHDIRGVGDAASPSSFACTGQRGTLTADAADCADQAGGCSAAECCTGPPTTEPADTPCNFMELMEVATQAVGYSDLNALADHPVFAACAAVTTRMLDLPTTVVASCARKLFPPRLALPALTRSGVGLRRRCGGGGRRQWALTGMPQQQ